MYWQRGKWLLGVARRLARHRRRRGRKRCTVGVTRRAWSSRCTDTSSRPSSRVLRCVGTASNAYLAEPPEKQGAVLLPAGAAWPLSAAARAAGPAPSRRLDSRSCRCASLSGTSVDRAATQGRGGRHIVREL